MTQKTIVWQFNENANGEWSWHRLALNGHAEHTCSGFTGIAKCIVDAMANGFKPDSETYATNSRSFNFVYEPSQPAKGAPVKSSDTT